MILHAVTSMVVGTHGATGMYKRGRYGNVHGVGNTRGDWHVQERHGDGRL